MKKLFLLLFVLLPMFLSAQNLVPKKHPKKDLYGYWGEKKNGKEGFVIKPQYSEVTKFAGGHAFVCKEGVWYIVGTDGEVISNKTYSKVEPLVSDVYLYRVWQSGNCGVVDLANNTEVLPVQYDKISAWPQGGYWLEANGKYALVDAMGKKLVKSTHYIGNGIYALYNDKWLFVNKDGMEVDVAKRVIYYSTNDGAMLSGRFGSSRHLFYGGNGVLVYDAPVTSIWEKAFYECRNLKSITIPDSVTLIGRGAFCECSSLTSITIPNSVTKIEQAAFACCERLTSVTIPNSVTSIGKYAFCECYNLKSVTIGNRVTSIGDKAFEDCWSLRDVYVNITDLAAYAAANSAHCIPGAKHLLVDGTEITELVFPNSVTSIRDQAFSGCSSLISVTIPNNVTSIGWGAFSDCHSLKNVDFQGTTPPSMGDDVFEKTSDNLKINVPKKALTAYLSCDWCFADKIKIPGFKIPANQVITYTTTDGCKIEAGYYNYETVADILSSSQLLSHTYENGIGKLVFSNAITSIEDSAFAWCSRLTSVTIPDSVTWIGQAAFKGCWRLTSITIPNSVTWIGPTAFADCSSLKHVTIPNGVTSIRLSVFDGCSSLTSVTIPDNVTSIGWGAFYKCSSLKSVTIPKSVTWIGPSAFAYCESLTSVTIPNGVTKIEQAAFAYCERLTSVTIPNSVTEIGEYAFYDCMSLKAVYCNAIAPPELGKYAFDYDAGRICCPIYVPSSSLNRYRGVGGWWNRYYFDLRGR